MIKIHEYQNYLLENEVSKNTFKNYLIDLHQFANYCQKFKKTQLNKTLMIEYKHYLKKIINKRKGI